MDEPTQLWLSAFIRLSRSREDGYSRPQPIRISEMRSYHDMMDLPADCDQMVDVMQAMDQVWLEDSMRRQEKK